MTHLRGTGTWVCLLLTLFAATYGGAGAALAQSDTDQHLTAQQCMSCHATEPGLSHPVAVRPSMHVPAQFPLQNGMITCITCHDDSLSAHNLGSGNLLRGALDGPQLCTQCHSSTEFTRQSLHSSILSGAHLAWPKRPSNQNSVNDSRLCLSCHDGAVAADQFLTSTGSNALKTLPAVDGALHGSTVVALGQGHPISVDYNDSVAGRSPDRRLVSKQLLDKRVRLEKGQVECISCHSLYSSEPRLLVMRNDESKLCLSCHKMQ